MTVETLIEMLKSFPSDSTIKPLERHPEEDGITGLVVHTPYRIPSMAVIDFVTNKIEYGAE